MLSVQPWQPEPLWLYLEYFNSYINYEVAKEKAKNNLNGYIYEIDNEDEFKKQSIFKYNYTLPADFPYKKTTTNPVGRVSDSLMSYGQKEPDKYLSDSYSGASYIDKEIVKNVLHFLQSENKNSAIYKYKVQTDCLNGQSLNDYKPSKFNGFAINIFYNQQGKVEAINFARDNYMVTIYNGKLNCVKGGKSIKSIEKK